MHHLCVCGYHPWVPSVNPSQRRSLDHTGARTGSTRSRTGIVRVLAVRERNCIEHVRQWLPSVHARLELRLAPPPFTCTPNIHLHPHPFTCTPTTHLHPRHLASPSSFSTSRASRVFAVASPPSSSRGLVAGKEDAALRSSSAGHHVLHMCCIDDQTPSRVTHDRGRRRKWQRPSPYVRMKSTVQRKNAAP